MNPYKPQKLPLNNIKLELLINSISNANREIGYFNGVLFGIPDAEILLSPLTTNEAIFSSKLEGTITSLEEVYKFEAGQKPDVESKRNDIQEVINYRNAMKAAEIELRKRPFNLNLLKRLHSVLLDSVRGRFKKRGSFRTTQNWIGPEGCLIEQANFVPPEPQEVSKYLYNWEEFYHSDSPDPLVQLSIIHAQFEIIHPFLDGNGRIGRMLIPLFLYDKKFISRPVFYISEYLEMNHDKYINFLRLLDQKPDSWHNWIIFFLKALEEQAKANSTKAKDILNLYIELKSKIFNLTHSRFAIPLLDQLFKMPIFQSSYLKEMDGKPSKPTINMLLTRLREDGTIKVLREGSGRRPYIFVLRELINLVEGRDVF